VSGTPWQPVMVGGRDQEQFRILDEDATLVAFQVNYFGEYGWEARLRGQRELLARNDARPLESIWDAMEAADLWAHEHGYPAVRVEVDP
jgi:hypothetical protein